MWTEQTITMYSLYLLINWLGEVYLILIGSVPLPSHLCGHTIALLLLRFKLRIGGASLGQHKQYHTTLGIYCSNGDNGGGAAVIEQLNSRVCTQ